MDKNQFKAGHPVHTYLVEEELIKTLLEELMNTNPNEEFQKFYNLFNHLATVERRFERKENQLFPFLEQKGWTGPSRNMWSFHDTIRDIFRIIRKNIDDKNLDSAKQNIEYAGQNLKNLMEVEKRVLFPNAMDILSDEEWIKMREGENEIGWMLNESPAKYPDEVQYVHPSEDTTLRTEVVFDENASHFDEGYMTVEQVNLLFRTLPLDLTYVVIP